MVPIHPLGRSLSCTHYSEPLAWIKLSRRSCMLYIFLNERTVQARKTGLLYRRVQIIHLFSSSRLIYKEQNEQA